MESKELYNLFSIAAELCKEKDSDKEGSANDENKDESGKGKGKGKGKDKEKSKTNEENNSVDNDVVPHISDVEPNYEELEKFCAETYSELLGSLEELQDLIGASNISNNTKNDEIKQANEAN